MSVLGSRVQCKCKTNHFLELQGCRCYVLAPMERGVVADYCAEANL